jgi:CMP/dCMP kinase
LVHVQRQIGFRQDTVTEGRDQGTVVFPKAECKIFLTASPEERARRRLADLVGQGETVTFDEVLAAQQKRDHDDATRAVGPLVPAADASQVLTDGLSHEQVVDRLESLARAAMSLASSRGRP